MADSDQKSKPDGTAFDDFFESIGKKAEHVSQNDSSAMGQASGVTNESVGTMPSDAAITPDGPDEQKVVDEIESLCMNCHENGITRLLLTRIPFFREIIIMSFYCPHCSFKNSEIQSAGEIQQKGCKYELRLTSLANFERQVVKSDTCVVKFIELDIEVPAGRGQLTNIEGLLSMILEDLEVNQAERKEQSPEVYAKIEEVVAQGRKMLAGDGFPFRLSLDDPAGNSWIEPDQKDGVGKLRRVDYARTPEQNEALGLGSGENNTTSPEGGAGDRNAAPLDDDIIPNEVYSFPATCPGCTRYCVTNMKMVDIPHFKQVVIMSTVCDLCGYRSNEVKTGGAVPLKGTKITLEVKRPADLGRDILKSESCAMESPELNLSVNPGTLGGRFTTVEGLLTQVRDDLHQHIFDVDDEKEDTGDSAKSDMKRKWKDFFTKLDQAIKGERKFTIILTDPLASSYVQNLVLPEDDPQITTEEYERTVEEEEDLGLLDMKTEGYEADVVKADVAKADVVQADVQADMAQVTAVAEPQDNKELS